jgi:hypothetical protein
MVGRRIDSASGGLNEKREKNIGGPPTGAR